MILTSPKNDWIRQLRQLHQPKGRREQHAFLVEGTHLVQEALATDWPLIALCYTPTWAEQHTDLIIQTPDPVRQQLVSESVLAALATTVTPDGVVAIAHRSKYHSNTSDPSDPQDLQLTSQLHDLKLAIAVETLQDPGNLGALIRTAVAAQADVLWISQDSVDPDHPKVLRASAGQWFRLPPQSIPQISDLIRACHHQQIQVLAATVPKVPEDSRIYWKLDLTQPTLFLLGNEGSGLSPALVQQADGIVFIPMADPVESLNISMTGGLLLYEAYRQRWETDIQKRSQTS